MHEREMPHIKEVFNNPQARGFDAKGAAVDEAAPFLAEFRQRMDILVRIAERDPNKTIALTAFAFFTGRTVSALSGGVPAVVCSTPDDDGHTQQLGKERFAGLYLAHR
ncbi:hypothetical protein D3C81_1609820 [compost metagenome]